jgi:hypothetical protein
VVEQEWSLFGMKLVVMMIVEARFVVHTRVTRELLQSRKYSPPSGSITKHSPCRYSDVVIDVSGDAVGLAQPGGYPRSCCSVM